MLENLVDYTGHVEQTYPSKVSQQLKLNAIRSLFTFGQKVGYLQFNIGAVVEAPKPENKLAERIIDAPRRQRNKVLLRLLYSSGTRVSEIGNPQWRHLQPNGETGQLTIYGKGQKTRFVPISKATYQHLLSIRPADAGPEDYIFVSQKGGNLDESAVLRKGSRAGCGIPGLSPHWLRHAHASHALARGANVAVVKETLGHSNIAVTNNYIHIKPNDSRAFYLNWWLFENDSFGSLKTVVLKQN
jgi:integrase/recombinase XerD